MKWHHRLSFRIFQVCEIWKGSLPIIFKSLVRNAIVIIRLPQVFVHELEYFVPSTRSFMCESVFYVPFVEFKLLLQCNSMRAMNTIKWSSNQTAVHCRRHIWYIQTTVQYFIDDWTIGGLLFIRFITHEQFSIIDIYIYKKKSYSFSHTSHERELTSHITDKLFNNIEFLSLRTYINLSGDCCTL